MEEPCPVRRSCHSAVCLGYGGDHAQLLITGGLDKHLAVLRDVWLLDVKFKRWKEVATYNVTSNTDTLKPFKTLCVSCVSTCRLCIVLFR